VRGTENKVFCGFGEKSRASCTKYWLPKEHFLQFQYYSALRSFFFFNFDCNSWERFFWRLSFFLSFHRVCGCFGDSWNFKWNIFHSLNSCNVPLAIGLGPVQILCEFLNSMFVINKTHFLNSVCCLYFKMNSLFSKIDLTFLIYKCKT